MQFPANASDEALDRGMAKLEEILAMNPDLHDRYMSGDEELTDRLIAFVMDDNNKAADFTASNTGTMWDNLDLLNEISDATQGIVMPRVTTPAEEEIDLFSEDETEDDNIEDYEVTAGIAYAVEQIVHAEFEVSCYLSAMKTVPALYNYLNSYCASLDTDLVGDNTELNALQRIIDFDNIGLISCQEHIYLTNWGAPCDKIEISGGLSSLDEGIFEPPLATSPEGFILGDEVVEDYDATAELSGGDLLSLLKSAVPASDDPWDDIDTEEMFAGDEESEDEVEQDIDTEISDAAMFDDEDEDEEFDSEPFVDDAEQSEDEDDDEFDEDEAILQEERDAESKNSHGGIEDFEFEDEDEPFEDDEISDDIEESDAGMFDSDDEDEDAWDEDEQSASDDSLDDDFEDDEFAEDEESLDEETSLDADMFESDDEEFDSEDEDAELFEEDDEESTEDDEDTIGADIFDDEDMFESDDEEADEDEDDAMFDSDDDEEFEGEVDETEDSDDMFEEDDEESKFEEDESEDDAFEDEADDFEDEEDEFEDEPEDTADDTGMFDADDESEFDELDELLGRTPNEDAVDDSKMFDDDFDDLYDALEDTLEGVEDNDSSMYLGNNPLGASDFGVPTVSSAHRAPMDKNEAAAEGILSIYNKLIKVPSIFKRVLNNMFTNEGE